MMMKTKRRKMKMYMGRKFTERRMILKMERTREINNRMRI